MAPNDSQTDPAEITYVVFASVNIAVSAACMLMNVFFVFCMVFPQQGTERLKQPLNVLLGSLVGSNIALHVFTLLSVVSDFMSSSNSLVYDVGTAVMLFTMRTSITSILWLNVFYYCQIVPAQHPFFIWLKKNIKVFIYSALIMDRMFFLYGFTVAVAYLVKQFESSTDKNTAFINNTTDPYMDVMFKTLLLDFWLRLIYFLLSLCVMLASSCATVLYLRRHMKSMQDSNSSFSFHLQKQMRVTMTGIIQALLYFFCSASMVANEILSFVIPPQYKLHEHILCTIILLYSFGTAVNMSIGQSIFRQRAINVWENILSFLLD
ncbi:taste receptor type 2 member 1-like [Colossoma macropomum]|uniref:taste receptor type 2 member 1-like n=1 Tax=Colossoma macropomum TaxID=42526 RepID=UPI001863D159|nr:taste receptor type 2 member 1-like [Colossoma macropomum]